MAEDPAGGEIVLTPEERLQEKLSGLEERSLYYSLAALIVLLILAWLSFTYNSWLLLAASAGALGGFVHEIAQSRGKIMFFHKYDDGFYLGSIAGMVLGAVTGILVIRGYLVATPSGATVSVSNIQLSYEAFLAGLALKGVVEAAAGNTVSKSDEKVPRQKPRPS